MTSSCSICYEPYTQKLRKCIECKFCEYKACTSCVKKYLLTITTDPKCAKCKIAWDPEFIDIILSKNFRLTEFKKHRETVLFEREKCLLPGTIGEVESTLEKRKKLILIDDLQKKKLQLQDEIEKLNLNIFDIRTEINTNTNEKYKRNFIKACPTTDCRGFLSTQWKCGICNIAVCNKCHDTLTQEHVCNKDNVESAKLLLKDTKSCPKCASNIYKIDGCFAKDIEIPMFGGGIKLSQDIVIGDVLIGDDNTQRIVEDVFTGVDELFEVSQEDGYTYCVSSKHKMLLVDKNKEFVEILMDDYLRLEAKDLFGIKSDSTTTNINVVSIGKGDYYGWMIDQNSRFLLKDGTIVHNCDMMFCTQCHTAFSWKTGVVEDSNIHNPHYYDWIRQNGGEVPRNNGDVPACARFPEFWVLNEYLKRNSLKFDYYNYHRGIRHIEQVELTRLPVQNQDNVDLRIKYLLSEISADDMKKELQKREAKNLKNISYRQIYEMLIAVGTDLMNKILNLKDNKDINTIHKEFEELRKYFNASMIPLSKRYNSRIAKQLDEKWFIVYLEIN